MKEIVALYSVIGVILLRTFLAMSEIVANSQMRGLSTRYMGWQSNKGNGWSYSSARLSMRSGLARFLGQRPL
jgi:hypothetical protein